MLRPSPAWPLAALHLRSCDQQTKDAPTPVCRWHRSVDQVAAALPADVAFTRWRLQIYAHTPYPSNYKQFQRKRGSVLAPLPAPEALSSLPPPAVQQEGSDKPAQESLPGAILLPEAFASLAAAEAEATRSPEVRPHSSAVLSVPRFLLCIGLLEALYLCNF